MDGSSFESHYGAPLVPGVSVGPGTLVNLHTGSSGTLQARLADHSDGLWAYGFAFTSGSGTKVTGYPQKVRVDRFGAVENIDYITFNPGAVAYLGEDGKYAVSGTQKVGFAIGANTVFVDLDMQLGS